MHELGIVFHIMDSLEEVGKENDLTSIETVTLEVGEVSAVIPEYLTDCWRWAAEKRDLFRGCRLIVEPIYAITRCEDCGISYRTVEHGRICPGCGSEKTYLLTGNEINIKEISAC